MMMSEAGATERAAMPRTGPLQPQEVVLALLGEYVPAGNPVWSGGLVHVLEDLGFTTAAARMALNRIVARGLLVRLRAGRLVYYAGMDRLETLLQNVRGHVFSRHRERTWDGSWY